MKPVKIAIIAALGVFAILTLVFSALASPSAGIANSFCYSCHAVRAEGQALSQTSHSGVPCLTCHQQRGIMGAVESIFDGASNLAWWANPFVGPPAAKSSVVDSDNCLLCHKRIVRSSDVIGSKLVVDHRHFKKVNYSCMECHRGVAHGDGLIRGGGMSKQLCLDCHNGIDASQECSVCHKEEVKGKRPSDQSTLLGIAHGDNWKKTHALANLKSCSLCHAPSDCKKCHGIGLPHDENFIYRHGKVAADKVKSGPEFGNSEAEASAQGDSPDKPKGAEAAVNDDLVKGQELFESRCQICHGLERPRNAPYKGDEWIALVQRMRGKGAPLSEAEAGLVVGYLKASNGGNDPVAEGGGASGGSARTKPGAVVTSPGKTCTKCHQKSYCRSCHGGIEMPHQTTWLNLHQSQTPSNKVAACFRCHVNEECISCHQGHKAKALRFPDGPK